MTKFKILIVSVLMIVIIGVAYLEYATEDATVKVVSSDGYTSYEVKSSPLVGHFLHQTIWLKEGVTLQVTLSCPKCGASCTLQVQEGTAAVQCDCFPAQVYRVKVVPQKKWWGG